MSIKWITADRIHNGEKWLPEDSVIGWDEKGTIQEIVSKSKVVERVEYIPGYITPGFINVHCHLELSHMKDRIPRNTGLVKFLQAVMSQRSINSLEEKQNAIIEVVHSAYQSGIVAFGDICNTADTLAIKERHPHIYFHSFIEALGRIPDKAILAFERSNTLYQQFSNSENSTSHLNTSIVPHAPYSISDPLMEMINRHSIEKVISIHSQETLAETELFENGTGEMLNFYQQIGIPLDAVTARNMNSLQWILEKISPTHPLILVHNTFISDGDRQLVRSRGENIYCCLCPKANIYIENVLPPIDKMLEDGLQLVIGTDSLSSNDSINILAEMNVIQNNFPSISWEEIIKWATYNGAKALGVEERFGCIKPGLKPGLVNISTDYQISKLLEY